ncbi:protein of unknown function [Nitrosomonas sp. Nm51]|uniref:DUF748 domain-containing protein n=1 Tax=Nitrosomonas sp. Nm51 TaxID=133720 RepID=UPI0008C97E31|nr:DUF748 domain-containing protein [Nitrosomonas sp. Nm51]SER03043.1 protein of unknown function [Nitrosomonas sp. Nm51]
MTQTQDKAQIQIRPPGTRFIVWKRLGIVLAVFVAMIALFGVLGYYWLPGYAKSQLELRLSVLLDRPVSVQAIEVKPYTLELFVHGFHIGERQDSVDATETFVSFNRLHIDISSESVTKRAPVISTITLDDLHIRLAREGENRFNFSDLIEKFSQLPEDEEDTSALFSVSNLVLRNGHIEWVDRFEQNYQEITEINFAVPFIANLDKVKDNWIEPHFSASVNGAPVRLDGKLRPFTDKREATLAFKVDDIDITRIDEYVPFPDGFSLGSGYFDSDLTVTFAQSGDGAPEVTLSGQAELRKVTVKNAAAQAPYRLTLDVFHLALDRFDITGRKPSPVVMALSDIAVLPVSPKTDNPEAAVSLAKVAVSSMVELAGQTIALKNVTVDGLNTRIHREAGGAIDLVRFFKPSDSGAAKNAVVEEPASEHETAIVKPRRKPSDEDYQAWLLAGQEAMQPAETKQTVASMPLPDRKPAYEVQPEQIKQTETAKESDSAQKEEGKAGPWVVRIDQFRLRNAAIHYIDLTLNNAIPMVVKPLNLIVTNIDISGVKPSELKLKAQVNEDGVIETEGRLAWSPPAVDLNLNLQAVDLVSLQGWAGDALNVLLTSGNFSFQGTVKAEGEPLEVVVNGQSRLDNFNVIDQDSARDLFRWKYLDIEKLDFVSDPLNINVDSVTLGDFFARVTLLPDGELNLKHIVRQEEEQTAEDVQIQAETEKKSESAPLPLRIGKILLQHGDVDFHDRFVEPNYRANLTGLTGQIGPIHAEWPGAIDIKGKIDGTAPLQIRGDIKPLGSELLLDIVAKAKEIDLPQFSPYSGKYVGYAIEKGKLSVDVHYHVEKGTLTAENNVFLDQFTLGKRVDSEEAVSVPLELAIALLKNRRGEIDIHLPVKGSIDDPQFSLGGIILDAFVNLITRAVTAPFALLGSLLEDGEELSEISFSPGFAEIDTEAESRLQALSDALKDRPALRLEIAGHVDPEEDREGLKHAILKRQIKAKKLAAEAKQGKAGGSLAGVTLTPEEYSQFLEVVYTEADFEKPTNFLGFTKSLPDAEMEQLLLTHIEVGEDDMQELARDRALAAQNWLLEKGGISGDRLFVMSEQETEAVEDGKGHRVEFMLK